MKRNKVSVIIYALIGLFFLSYIPKLWIIFEPIDISSDIIYSLDTILSFIRWPCITAALVLAIVKKKPSNIPADTTSFSDAKPAQKETNYALVWIVSIIAIVAIISLVFFVLILMSAQYI